MLVVQNAESLNEENCINAISESEGFDIVYEQNNESTFILANFVNSLSNYDAIYLQRNWEDSLLLTIAAHFARKNHIKIFSYKREYVIRAVVCNEMHTDWNSVLSNARANDKPLMFYSYLLSEMGYTTGRIGESISRLRQQVIKWKKSHFVNMMCDMSYRDEYSRIKNIVYQMLVTFKE